MESMLEMKIDMAENQVPDTLNGSGQARLNRMFAQQTGKEDISRRDECVKHFNLF